jgi:hypothetical protein
MSAIVVSFLVCLLLTSYAAKKTHTQMSDMKPITRDNGNQNFASRASVRSQSIDATEKRMSESSAIQKQVVISSPISKSTDIGTESPLAAAQRKELQDRYSPGAVQYKKPMFQSRQNPIDKLREKEAAVPPEFEAKANQSMMKLRYSSYVKDDAGQLMDKTLKKPIMVHARGKSLLVDKAHQALEAKLLSGETSGQMDSMKVVLTTKSGNPMLVTVEGVRAIGDEDRSVDGWYQHQISAAELQARHGTFDFTLSRPFDQKRSSVVYYYGAQMMDRDTSKRIIPIPGKDASHVAVKSLEVARLQGLGHKFEADSEGYAVVAHDILHPVVADVKTYLEGEADFLDLNNLAIKFEPIGATNTKGETIRGSANFKSLRADAGNQVEFGASITFNLRMIDPEVSTAASTTSS